MPADRQANCPHTRLDRTDTTSTCRDCGHSWQRQPDHRGWITHIRQRLADTPPPQHTDTPDDDQRAPT